MCLWSHNNYTALIKQISLLTNKEVKTQTWSDCPPPPYHQGVFYPNTIRVKAFDSIECSHKFVYPKKDLCVRSMLPSNIIVIGSAGFNNVQDYNQVSGTRIIRFRWWRTRYVPSDLQYSEHLYSIGQKFCQEEIERKN